MASRDGVFISYAKQDQVRLEPLAQYLSDEGFAVLFDSVGPAINEALDQVACIVVAWTTTSVASQDVQWQASQAQRRAILVPLLLDSNAQVPEEFAELRPLDLSSWDGTVGTELQQLADRVRSLVQLEPGETISEDYLSDDQKIAIAQRAVSEFEELTDRIPDSISTVLIESSGAAADLRGALDQVSRTYDVVDAAIGDFIGAGTAGIKDRTIDPDLFGKWRGGSLKKRIRSGSGHCGFIRLHYRRHDGLRRQITGRLSPEDLKKADQIFDRLSQADGDLFAELTNIGDVLTSKSSRIVNLVRGRQEEHALKIVSQDLEELLPLQDQLSEAMAKLQQRAYRLGYAESE